MLHSTKDKNQPKHTSHQETGVVTGHQETEVVLDSKTKTQHITRKQKADQLSEVDHVPTNTRSSHNESQLCIFEDNEAVIKMIIKGRSPTMRHVSRTHRVALDWLFDRINLDSKIQIKCVDTRNQLADILTEGSFTRDEWDRISRCFLAAIFFHTDSRRFASGETETNEFAVKEPLDCDQRSSARFE